MRACYRLFLGMLLAFAAGACAAEPDQVRYNVVELQAEAQREVQNDLLHASLYVELNDADPAKLANMMNKGVNDALRIAKDYKSVRVHAGSTVKAGACADKCPQLIAAIQFS